MRAKVVLIHELSVGSGATQQAAILSPPSGGVVRRGWFINFSDYRESSAGGWILDPRIGASDTIRSEVAPAVTAHDTRFNVFLSVTVALHALMMGTATSVA